MLNLKSRFGKVYRVLREEGADKNDPWGIILACRHGHVYVQGEKLLGVATNSRGPTARRLAALPGVKVVQDGTDGINATFDPSIFPAVAAIIRPRARRRLSAEHKAKLIAAGKRFQRGSNSPRNDAKREATGMDGPTADLAA